MSKLYDKVYGALIGGLIGDAMGAPSEGMTWREIREKFGVIDGFEGSGTDDSAIKQILCEAIIESGGHPTADDFAASFLRNEKYYGLFYIPVRNMYYKLLTGLVSPIEAGYGNMQSSSSAMAISPIGIINACNPRQAAIEAYDIAGLIHSGPSGFCRDGASAVAAAVAEAFRPEASVASIVAAGTAYLHQTSAADMIGRIKSAVAAAKAHGSYEDFRDWFYENCLQDTIADSRETIPCVFALFYLAEGDPQKAIVYSANFGRDADTIGTIAGAIAGAFQGACAIRGDWVEKVEAAANTVQANSKDYGVAPAVLADQRALARRLLDIIGLRREEERAMLAAKDFLAGD